jgi:hypothetical protein
MRARKDMKRSVSLKSQANNLLEKGGKSTHERI